MDRLCKTCFAAAFLCGAVPAFAASTTATTATNADADAGTGPDIVITGECLPYGVKVTSTATKTNTDIKNIPQALTIISGAQIGDQQLRSIGDLLLFVPGASYNSGEGN